MIAQDNLNITQNAKLQEGFTATETILYSGELLKVNKKNSKQKRKIVITTESIYNIRDANIFTSIGFGSLIKRRINITSVKAIIYARLGNEFVIHVPDEFDYRIVDPQKDNIIRFILHALSVNEMYETKIFFNSDVELHKFTTHNSMKKKGIKKEPAGEPMMMTCETFQAFLDEKLEWIGKEYDNTEMLINFLNNFNKITLSNFDILKVLGKGGFATVYLAQKKDTEEFFALKAIKKQQVIKQNQFAEIRREKEILNDMSFSPFLVDLKCAFQTPDKLWLVMPYIAGGDLSQHLKKRGTFWENEVKFFAAQIILGLQDLHSKNIIYQDLKPANVLLDTNGFVKLTDFGASKYSHQTKNYKTFVGTLDFIPPEIFDRQPYNNSIDWWALGLLVYQLLYGYLPFHDKDIKKRKDKILHSDVEFPEDECSVGAISDKCKDFIRSCLKKDPKERIGYNSVEEQMNHTWFEEVEFDKHRNFLINPPVIPEMDEEHDISDDKISEKSIVISLLSEGMLNEVQRFDPMFKGFYLDQLNPCEDTQLDCQQKMNENNLEIIKNQVEIENNPEKQEDKSMISRPRLGSLGNQSKKTSTHQDDDNLSFTASKTNNQSARRGKYSEMKLDISISRIDNMGDDAVSVSEVGSRLVSPPPQSPTMSATKEGRIGYKFNFELQSPSVLLIKERSMTQSGIESTIDGITNNKKNDDENTNSPVRIKKKILDDDSISNSESNKSVNIDLQIDKNSTNESSNVMDNKSPLNSNEKLINKSSLNSNEKLINRIEVLDKSISIK